MQNDLNFLVNGEVLKGCVLRWSEQQLPVLDVSYIRIVVKTNEVALPLDNTVQVFELSLYKNILLFEGMVEKIGEGWARLRITKLPPSHISRLKLLLSPKIIGESIKLTLDEQTLKHYHGLNETDLWVTSHFAILFSFLDSEESKYQFIVRIQGDEVQIGWIEREVYLELSDFNRPIPLKSLNEKLAYLRLCESRDIVTNLRPKTQQEYTVKQTLLKHVNEHLFFASRRAEMNLKKASYPPPSSKSSSES